jgi:hypothetical protein
VQPPQVDQLVADGHLRVQPALLRHVSEALPIGPGQRPPAEGHRAGVGGEHTEDDPHRGGLAGSVGADEPGQPAGGDVERDLLEHRTVAEVAAHAVESQ